jgi:Uma2 family endonuclease
MGNLYMLLARLDLPGLAVTLDAEVVVKTRPRPTVRAPDVLVADREAAATLPRFTPDQVRLAVEILSPGTRTTDRVAKLHEYAAAGIGEYWILDPDTATLSTFTLAGGVYQLTGTHTGLAKVTACGEPLTIDLDELLTV